MLELDFAVERAEPAEHAATSELALTLAVRARDGRAVHGVLLACQVRLDVVRRSYDDVEADRLHELFGPRADWARSQQSLCWAQPTLLVPAFEATTTVRLPLACSLDFELGTAKYLQALAGGVIPLLLLFSGTIFYADDSGRLQAMPIARTAECRFALPHEVYRATVTRYFGDRAPVTLQRDVLERLTRYRRKSGAATLDGALAELLDRLELVS